MALKTKDEINNIFDAIYDTWQTDVAENRILYEHRTHETGVAYSHNFELEKRVRAAISLRRKLAEVYNSETRKVIFEVLEDRISQKRGNRRYFLGVMLFLDYLHTEQLYSIFSDKDKYYSPETKTRNKLIFKMIQYADSHLTKGVYNLVESFTIFLGLAYCYKYLYRYQEAGDINFFNRLDANCGKQYIFSDLRDLMCQLQQTICRINKVYNVQIILDFIMQIEVNRELDNQSEENQVSFKGMNLLFLKDDQAIKFIVLRLLYEFLHEQHIYKATEKLKYVQYFFFVTAKQFHNIDQKFLWMYLQKLLKEKEYDLYGHLLRTCPEIYAVVKLYFEKQNIDYVAMLLKETEDSFGNLIYALYECEYHKDILKFEQFAADKGFVKRHNWYAWFIILQKYVVYLKRAIHQEELELVNHRLLEDLRDVSRQYPVSGFSTGERRLLAETLLSLMIQYLGKGGNLNTLMQVLGENNLLQYQYGNWSLLKHIKNQKSPIYQAWKEITTYLKRLSKEEAWNVYMNSAVRFILSIQEIMNIMGKEWPEFAERIIWRFNIKRLNPEEQNENRIELYSYDFFVDENYVLRPEPEWSEQNYPYLCNVKYMKYEVVQGYPIRAEDGVIYIRVVTEPSVHKVEKKDLDYKKVLRWMDEVRSNDYVYNPFLLYSKEGQKNNVYLTDKKEFDSVREDRAVFCLPKPQEEDLRVRFATSIFETMLSFKRKKLLLKKFLFYVSKTSISYVNEYFYEFGKSTEGIVRMEELANRAEEDLERLCSGVQAGSMDTMQNLVNIYANSYLKHYVDLSTFIKRLSRSFSDKVMQNLGNVQAYGYEERMYSHLYFHFKLCAGNENIIWKPCMFTQEDTFCENLPSCEFLDWKYCEDRNRYIFCSKRKDYFRQKKSDIIYMTLDMYGNEKVYLKSMRTNSKADDAEELQRLFTQLCKDKGSEEKALMKAIKEALTKMKKLDLVKQRFLAINIERVLEQRKYNPKMLLGFAKMIKEVEQETHEKVFNLNKPHFNKEEALFVRREFEDCSKHFVEEAVSMMNTGKYARGLASFVEIYNMLIYGQCIGKKEVIQRLDGKLEGYSREDIVAFLNS